MPPSLECLDCVAIDEFCNFNRKPPTVTINCFYVRWIVASTSTFDFGEARDVCCFKGLSKMADDRLLF